jgi:S1-C subfamily serine protease
MSTNQRTANLISGAVGGLVAVVVGAILIATNVIDTGDETVVKQSPIVQPAASGNSDEGGSTVSQIYDHVGPGVAFIQARVVQPSNSPFGPQQSEDVATGSGFVLDKDGNILTNAHVVDGARDVQVRFSHQSAVPAKIVGKDLSTDLAVLKVDPSKVKLTPLQLGDSKKLEVGDPVVAIGNPFGFDNTVTTGIVSALQRQITAPNNFQIKDVIQTDAAINPGNSGGPLLNAAGQVIGVNSQIATGGSGNGSVGIGFAVPINTAKRVIPQLEEHGKVQRPYLGVETTDVTSGLARDLNLPVEQGALITTVVPNGPADKAGLRGGRTQTTAGLLIGGDVIVKVDGKDVKNANGVAAAIEGKKPGDEVTVEYYRGNDKKTAKLKLGERPENLSGSGDVPQQDQGGGNQDQFPFPFP